MMVRCRSEICQKNKWYLKLFVNQQVIKVHIAGNVNYNKRSGNKIVLG